MSVHPKTTGTAMRKTLIDVLGGVLAGSLVQCTPSTPPATGGDAVSSNTSPTPTTIVSPTPTTGVSPTPTTSATSPSGADPCARFIVTKSAKVRVNEKEACDLLGPDPGYSIPIGPHTTQPGACERLCKDTALSTCQLPGDAFMAYKQKNTHSKCPTGYLAGGTAELTCEARIPNPGYLGIEKCPEPVGRPPAGFRASIADAKTIAEYLSNAAEVEAASVDGFLAVRDALARFGAPADLVRQCDVAADEEAHHAVMMRALATRRGSPPVSPTRCEVRETTMLDLAIENASVGVVRETFGALLALHQAECAPDADVRDAMTTIARDECAHAALSAAIDAWLSTQLDASSWARVSAARQHAIDELDRSIADGSLALPAALGMPSPTTARRLLVAVDAAVWAAYG